MSRVRGREPKEHGRGGRPSSPSKLDLINDAHRTRAEAGAWTSCCKRCQTNTAATNIIGATYGIGYRNPGRGLVSSHSYFSFTLEFYPLLPIADTIVMKLPCSNRDLPLELEPYGHSSIPCQELLTYPLIIDRKRNLHAC